MSGKPADCPRKVYELVLGESRILLGAKTKIMGVLNVTPDSFSDGGKYLDPGRAAAAALRMQSEGADILDVGGESSRPGALPVSAREEIRRIQPVLRRISRTIQIPISVDTYKYDVASMALNEGAVMINDIYALRNNRRLAKMVARYKAALVLMHMRGTPGTMQKNTAYKDLTGDICVYLRTALDRALSCGISRESLVIDPGFGFGKTTQQNLRLLTELNFFSRLKFPLVAGLSRKSFIGGLLGPLTDSGTALSPDQRLYGSLAAAAAAIERGAHILRVHEVLPHRHLAAIMDAVITRDKN